MKLVLGTTVDRYTVDAVIGAGGTAMVYRVSHNALGTLHALKVLTISSESIRKRMMQEGQVQAALQQRLTGLGAHHPGGQGIPQGTQALQHVMETPRHQYQHPLQMHALQMQQHMQQQRSQQMQQQMQVQRSQLGLQLGQQQQQTLTYETLINMVESAVRSQMEKKPS